MDAIVELTNVDFSSTLIAVCTILIGIKSIVSIFEWVITKLGIETKWMRKEREEHELLIQTSQNLITLQKHHDDDVKQSIRHDNIIKRELMQLTDTVNGIAESLNSMQEKDNQTKIKELKDSLIRYYHKYKDIGEWSKLEKEAFWDLFDDYEKRGGDGYIHSIVEPVMRDLRDLD